MDITQILTLNYPESQWTLDGEDYAGLTWLSDTPKPTKAALEKQSVDVEHKTAVEKNDQDRRNAYQTESDPLFFQWQRGEATEQAWKDKVAEIQARYPEPTKPNS